TNIWFGVGAPTDGFVIPDPAAPVRADNLWQTTCFDALLRIPGGAAYHGWAFAPSGEWTAYDFERHREGRSNAEVAAPYIRIEDNLTWWALGATIPVDGEGVWAVGLSAILEEADGTKSYWALAHPPGDKPDFHAADCFAASLP